MFIKTILELREIEKGNIAIDFVYHALHWHVDISMCLSGMYDVNQ